jgi:hypothetical protein
MSLFHFLVAMANVQFVLGLLFSIQIKHMGALFPAFVSAGLIFWGAYVEFNEIPPPFTLVTQSCLVIVGLGYWIAAGYYFQKSRKRPNYRSQFYLLAFIGAIPLAAAYCVLKMEWPLKLSL